MKIRRKILIICLVLVIPAIVFGISKIEKKDLTAQAYCTERWCGAPDICCNACGHQGWETGAPLYLEAYAVLGKLPHCAVDGCGNCSFYLSAYGYQISRRFYVVKWTEKSYETKMDLRGVR